ncbi:MAG: LPS export ABC transporter protein LptC [Crocinitomix sp.]|jgi:LPS export ABC transporter protein LptC
MMGMLFSCENDLGTIQVVTSSADMPDEIVNDMHTLYSDSGVVVYEMIATRMEKFGEPKNVRLFKDGFQVNFFKEKDSIVSTLTADYAEIRERDNVIIARNNVIFTNFEKNQTLKTEELFWDQTKKRVRTEKYFEVIGEKTTVKGYGLDTDETFTDYNMHKVSVESQNTNNNNDSIK